MITLTTDFGHGDPYVGIMKGVILTIAPDTRIVDLSHQIKAGSIIDASAVIREAYTFFPEGAVHLAVVDPGVGGDRRPLLIKTETYLFVGPDNGIFWPVIAAHPEAMVIHLTERRFFLPDISHTFHGRDIFAPVAAHLAKGIDPLAMGEPLHDPVQLPIPMVKNKGDVLSGHVIRSDHFGNLITNIPSRDLERFLRNDTPFIKIGNIQVKGMVKTYSEADAGEPLALIGSSGHLEIAVNLGSASDRLGLEPEGITGIGIEVRKI